MFVPVLSRRSLQAVPSAVRPVQSRCFAATARSWDGLIKPGEPSSRLVQMESAVQSRRYATVSDTASGAGSSETSVADSSSPTSATQAEEDEDDRILAEELGFSPYVFAHGITRPKNEEIGHDKVLEGLSSERPPNPNRPPPPQLPYVSSPRARQFARPVRTARDRGQTAKEADTFDEILSTIFAGLEQAGSNLKPRVDGSSNSPEGPIWGPMMKERRRVRPYVNQPPGKTDPATQEEVDRLKEEMSLIGTDFELAEWASEKIFKPLEEDEHLGPVFSKGYPILLAALIHNVRTHFGNAHLALALFLQAQNHSPESYLSGCMTEAYNEVLTIRWEHFKDLDGVEQGVREMEVNGVPWDDETQRVVGKVVEDVGRDVLDRSGVSRWGQVVFERLQKLEMRVRRDLTKYQKTWDEGMENKRDKQLAYWYRKPWSNAGAQVFASQHGPD